MTGQVRNALCARIAVIAHVRVRVRLRYGLLRRMRVHAVLYTAVVSQVVETRHLHAVAFQMQHQLLIIKQSMCKTAFSTHTIEVS